MAENKIVDDDGVETYRTFMKMSCPRSKLGEFYIIIMDTEEWKNLTYMYNKPDGNGGYFADTSKLIQACHKVENKDPESDEDKTKCFVRLGHYHNYEELGLSDPWQYQAGWIGMPGGRGVLGGLNFRVAEEGLNPGGPFPNSIYKKGKEEKEGRLSPRARA